jgi:predicted transposase YdaD
MLTGWDWDRAKIVWQREAREDGLEDGLIAGRLEGEKKGMQRAVVKLLKFGLSPADIAKALEIPEADVTRYVGKA